MQEEAERKREERRKARLQQLWASKNYRSALVSLSDDETDETELDEAEGRVFEIVGGEMHMSFARLLDDNDGETKLHHVFGDVMKPQLHGEKCAISVHCVGQ